MLQCPAPTTKNHPAPNVGNATRAERSWITRNLKLARFTPHQVGEIFPCQHTDSVIQ